MTAGRRPGRPGDDRPIQRYFALAEALSSAGSARLVAREALVKDSFCRRCFASEWEDSLDHERCSACGKARGTFEAIMPTGESQGWRRRRALEPAEELAELSVALKALTRWELRAWWAYAVLGAATYEGAARECRRRWPRHRRKWTRDYVGGLVRSARAKARRGGRRR